MSRMMAFLMLCFLAPTAYAADVLYTCNTERNYIRITEENFTRFNPVAGEEEIISTSDITEIQGVDHAAYRKGTKPIVKRCHLSSGEYVVTFDAHWVNGNINGLDADDWVTVEIRNKKGVILSRTVVGRCENSRPITKGCKDRWVVEVWVNGQDGSQKLTRLVDELSLKPAVNADRTMKPSRRLLSR